MKTGQGTAIYTAECGHAFHFPCIAAHVRKHGSLVCPVCNATWKDVPLLAAHKNLAAISATQNDVAQRITQNPNANVKKTTEPTSPVFKTYNHVEPPPKHSDSIRSYDDDEPLHSPTSGGRIIPIPEADENAEEDDEEDAGEFQGFFVNTKNSSSKSYSDSFQTTEGDSRTVQVKLMPECAVISASRTHETYALVLKIKAPPPPPAPRSSAAFSQRAPIDLVTVLDVGGSMTGAKLHMLKRAMRLVISSLGPSDRLSIVAFSGTSKRLLPLRIMTAQGQRVARRIVDRLVVGQGSSVGDALRKATRVLEDRRERNPVASVMLLSDGQEERVQNQRGNSSGSQRKSSTHMSSTRFAHIEIPVHAFGFGAKSGYSQEPGEEAFAKCVGGLLSVVVQDLRIQVGFESEAVEMSAIYSCSGRPSLLSSGAVRLGDLYAEEERELLVELRVPASSGPGTHHVMAVRCLYKDPASQEIVYGREQGLLVPPPQSLRCSGTRIQKLRNLFITTRAIAESKRLLEHNADFTSAHHLLASARALLMHSNAASAEDYVRALETELAELHWRRQHEQVQQQQQIVQQQQRRRGSEREMTLVDENGEPLTPTSAWRAAEKLAKMAMMKKSLNRVSDLHGFENARF